VPQTPKPNLEPPAELSKVELDSDALQPDESEALLSGPEALPQVADVLPDAADVLPQVTATLSEETDLASESIEPLPEAVETPAEAGDFLSELETAVQDTPTLESGETTTHTSSESQVTKPLV
jgi:hypothetical protein